MNEFERKLLICCIIKAKGGIWVKNRRSVIENRRKLMLEEIAKNSVIDIDNLAKKWILFWVLKETT